MTRAVCRQGLAAVIAALLITSVAPAFGAGRGSPVAAAQPAHQDLKGRGPGRLARLGGKVRGLLNTLRLCRIRTPVSMSNRHWHPTTRAFKACFGDLQPDVAKMIPLSQPGEYATNLKVDLQLGGGKVYRGVRVLWPPRDRYASGQAELAPSDFASIGLPTPAVNNSGDHRNTIGATVAGPGGRFAMKEGVMAAATHVHVSSGYAVRNGLRDGERVDLQVNGARPTTFKDVKIRINSRYPTGTLASDAHIDKDQAGAAVWSPGTEGYIRKQSPLRRLGRWLGRGK